MNSKVRRHTIDVVFVITLFSCFAISIIMITGMGASVYQNIVDHMSRNYNSRTAYSYIINKVHQSDVGGNITVDFYSNEPALVINEEIDNITYCTYLYYYDGFIKEVFTRKGQSFDLSYGNNILEVNDFKVIRLSDSLIQFNIVTKDNETKTLFTHIHSK